MKKTYMQPAMLVVKTNVVKMICISTLGETNKKSGNLSKRRGIFQDDASEEEEQSIW